MAIPTQDGIGLPLLELLGDGEIHNLKEAAERLAQHFDLTDDEKGELLPSGSRRFANRVAWTRWTFKSASLLESPQRGTLRITEQGREVLKQKPLAIDRTFLMQFGANDTSPVGSPEAPGAVSEDTPLESMANAYRAIQENIADEILDTVKQCSSQFFERLVVDLLIGMGYGGSQDEAGQVIGGPGDAGIDGVIKEDRLGLEAIYIQAKRWKDATVGRTDVQRFVGAMQGQNARKGVFITTSEFVNSAKEYTDTLSLKVVLIGGRQLAALLIEYGIGIETEATYEIKRIKSSYFDE